MFSDFQEKTTGKLFSAPLLLYPHCLFLNLCSGKKQGKRTSAWLRVTEPKWRSQCLQATQTWATGTHRARRSLAASCRAPRSGWSEAPPHKHPCPYHSAGPALQGTIIVVSVGEGEKKRVIFLVHSLTFRKLKKKKKVCFQSLSMKKAWSASNTFGKTWGHVFGYQPAKLFKLIDGPQREPRWSS